MISETALRRISAVLALIGLGIATYIAISDANAGAPSCLIGQSTGCLTVAQSKYAHLLGINVAIFGIVGYVLIFVSSIVPRDPGRVAAFTVSLVGFGFSLFLTYLELFEINAICQWCVGSAVVMTLLFIVNSSRALMYVGTDLPPEAPLEEAPPPTSTS